jgi:hypothetical protein
VPEDAPELKFGNRCYFVEFEEREHQGTYGHAYRFFLIDAVEDVPEYVVNWENFEKYVASPITTLQPCLDNALGTVPRMPSRSIRESCVVWLIRQPRIRIWPQTGVPRILWLDIRARAELERLRRIVDQNGRVE